MHKLCGVKLSHDEYMSSYNCKIPLHGATLDVGLYCHENDAKLPEMIKTAESVIKSWDKFLARAVPPLRTHLLKLKYEEYAKLDASEFIEPSLSMSDKDDYYLFDLLLNLPELKMNEYFLRCSFKSLDAKPTESDVELVSGL